MLLARPCVSEICLPWHVIDLHPFSLPCNSLSLSCLTVFGFSYYESVRSYPKKSPHVSKSIHDRGKYSFHVRMDAWAAATQAPTGRTPHTPVLSDAGRGRTAHCQWAGTRSWPCRYFPDYQGNRASPHGPGPSLL